MKRNLHCNQAFDWPVTVGKCNGFGVNLSVAISRHTEYFQNEAKDGQDYQKGVVPWDRLLLYIKCVAVINGSDVGGIVDIYKFSPWRVEKLRLNLLLHGQK